MPQLPKTLRVASGQLTASREPPEISRLFLHTFGLSLLAAMALGCSLDEIEPSVTGIHPNYSYGASHLWSTGRHRRNVSRLLRTTITPRFSLVVELGGRRRGYLCARTRPSWREPADTFRADLPLDPAAPRVSCSMQYFQNFSVAGFGPSSAANASALSSLSRQRSIRFRHSSRPVHILRPSFTASYATTSATRVTERIQYG